MIDLAAHAAQDRVDRALAACGGGAVLVAGPEVGADNETVLGGLLGLSPAEIAGLRQRKVL